jgi:N-acetylmuramoyl-L-alanine amidase
MVLTPHYPGVRAGKDVCLTAVRAQGADWVIDGGPQTYAWHRVGDTLVVDFIHCVPGPSVQVPAPAHLELLTQSPYPVTRLTWPLTGAFALSAGPPFTVRLGEVPPFPSKGFQSGVPIIVLDPGHGGADPGAIAANGLEEKTVTLTMARKLQAALEARGWRVLMTRTTDQEMRPEAKDAEELGARVALADAPQVRAFVSLHCDESSCGSATGATVHWSKPMDRPLADALGQDLNLPDYSIDRSPFYVLRHAAVPSVLIELGYLSTRMDAARLAQDGYCTGLATHLADSLTRWLRTADRLQPVVSDPPDSTVAGK